MVSSALSTSVNEALEQIGQSDDKDINLADAALLVAALESPGLSIERYQNHIRRMSDEVGARYKALIGEGALENAQTQLAALKHVIVDTHGYEGDRETYDDIQNVNLIRVIERRKGMPVSLALLYIHLGNMQKWEVCALNFPAHVICRIEKNGERLLFDPFNKCEVMQAANLRQLLKNLVGPQAELSVEYYEPSSKREVLIRMQNNIKLRQVEMEDYNGAAQTVAVMRKIDPDEYRLLLDAGVLYARVGQVVAAVDALEEYIDLVPSFEDRREALALLQQIRESLN